MTHVPRARRAPATGGVGVGGGAAAGARGVAGLSPARLQYQNTSENGVKVESLVYMKSKFRW